MTSIALAARHAHGPLRLFLRLVRSSSGIYVVFAAGQQRPGVGRKAYNPHASWHRDGRVHQKSYNRTWTREKRQALGNFAGSEPFVVTPTDQMVVHSLPECVPPEFDSVMEVDVDKLGTNGACHHVNIDLVAESTDPLPLGSGGQALNRWFLDEASRLSWSQLSSERPALADSLSSSREPLLRKFQGLTRCQLPSRWSSPDVEPFEPSVLHKERRLTRETFNPLSSDSLVVVKSRVNIHRMMRPNSRVQ